MSARRAPRTPDPLRSLRSSSLATSRSSNGIFRPPSNSWPCSCPLPAITTVSPGSAAASASAIAARRSGSTRMPRPAGASVLGRRIAHSGQDLGDDRPRLLRARVVGGHHARVGEPRGDLPHQRALLAIAVAAAPEDGDQPPSVSLRAASSTFWSESGVCA